MNREQYIQKVIEAYLDSPDTPKKPRPRDWAIATTFYKSGLALDTVLHALRLAILRRHRRDPDFEILEPIRSLAYFRPQIIHLHQHPDDPGYAEYVKHSYETRLDGWLKNGG